MKADILQILHEEATTQYNPNGKDERVVNSDEFDTVANQIVNLFKDKKYTEEDMLKAIEKARDIFDGKDCFTAEDVSGCTEVCTYNWKFQFSEDEIINSLNKQD